MSKIPPASWQDPEAFEPDEVREADEAEHRMHEEHEDHLHGDGCGHEAVEHDGHTDYLHGHHRHFLHRGHWDEH